MSLKFFVLHAADDSLVVQLQQLSEIVRQFVFELLLLELEVRNARKKLIGEELVVSAVGEG